MIKGGSMFKKIAVAVVLNCIAFLSVYAFAMCGTCVSGEGKSQTGLSSSAIKINNTICPVTGEKVDMNNPVTVEHKGKIYNLCCAMCIKEFKSDPNKYITKVGEQNK